MTQFVEVFKEQKYFQDNSLQLSVGERIALLKKLRAKILEQQGQIISALEKDFGKPGVETEMTEIFPTISEINHICKKLRTWTKKEKVPTPLSLFPNRSYILREPKGVVLIISPWNYPFQLAMIPLITSIAAGNSNIVKPSEFTPHTSAIIEKIVLATCPKSVARVFQGGVELSKELLKQSFNHIFFTGSTQVGKIIMQAASQHLASLTLELGGKSPVIVDESAAIEDAVEKILWGKCINAGQTCVAPDYIYVHEDIKEEFNEALKQKYAEYYPNSDIDFAKIVNRDHFLRLKALAQSSVQQGAKEITPLSFNEEQNSFSLCILNDVEWDHPIMTEEIFGPILPILTFTDIEKVCEKIMLEPRPLALYIFSRNRKNIQELLFNTRSGGVCINQTAIHLANHHLPFGGVGPSGMGAYHGYHGFEELSHRKSVLVGSRWNLIKFFYPPYTDGLKKLLFYFKKIFY